MDYFIPRGKNVKGYDINSLYPYAMLNNMPINKAIKSTDNDLDKYFGVVCVEVHLKILKGNI